MDKLNLDEKIKGITKLIYKEELWSFLCAIIFAMNIACILDFEFNTWTIINAFCAGLMLTKFKPTVKQQFLLHSYLGELKKRKSEKVWTTKNS